MTEDERDEIERNIPGFVRYSYALNMAAAAKREKQAAEDHERVADFLKERHARERSRPPGQTGLFDQK